jgi:co-chaperonin GroES (HSP10)
MDKNIIKKYLSETFLSEAKKNETKTSPGIKLAGKMANDNKKINKAGVDAVGKDMTDLEKSSKKTDANGKTMATNKFNYEGKEEKDYHDQMEIMNGQEMIQYDRNPGKQFKDRAEEAIAGSTRMGNNPEWANVVAPGQGGDPTFGKKLVKAIKASEKKRSESKR